MQKPAPDYSVDLVGHPEHDAAFAHFADAARHPFQPDPAGFPRVNAWWLAEAALATYWDAAPAIGFYRAAGLEAVGVTGRATDSYVAWDRDWLAVAFRGTEPDQWEDVLTDVRAALVDWPGPGGGRVHEGFKAALDAVWPALEPILEAQGAGRTVWFCGHSLGAALATLAAARYPNARGVCTFGSPRVGDRVFAAAFDERFAGRSLRYVNHYDVVTHVPPPLLGPWRYDHVDAGRFITADGVVTAQPPALLHFFSDLIGAPGNLAPLSGGLVNGPAAAPQFLLDHMPKAYAIWTWNDFDANG